MTRLLDPVIHQPNSAEYPGTSLDPIDGIFGPRSMSWRVLRERAGLLGGGRAILMQLAHPVVAAGVAEHSRFRDDPLARLERTLEMMLTIVFGDRAAATAMLRRFHALHAGVRGTMPEPAGPFPAGAPYTAGDPEAKLWVHATLVDSALLTYQCFVAPLTRKEREAFYAESARLAPLLGIPATIVPPTLEDFGRYMERMLGSDVLTVTDTARGLAHSVLHPPRDPALRAAMWPARFVTAGVLPTRLRRDFGLCWDPRRQAILDGLGHLSRAALPRLPGRLRFMPQARSAARRLEGS